MERIRRRASSPDVLRASPSKDVSESGGLRVHHPRDRAGGETIAQSPSGRGVDPAVREPPRVIVNNLFVPAKEKYRKRLLFENRAGPERVGECVHFPGAQGPMLLRKCCDDRAHRRHGQAEDWHSRTEISSAIRGCTRVRSTPKFL